MALWVLAGPRKYYNLIGPPNVCATTHELSKLGFSFLADIFIETYHPDSEYPPQNLLSRVPTFKDLTLENFIATDGFSIASSTQDF